MLESANDHFGDDTLWTFQQDGATTHTANITQNWCSNQSSTILVEREMASMLPRPQPDELLRMVSS